MANISQVAFPLRIHKSFRSFSKSETPIMSAKLRARYSFFRCIVLARLKFATKMLLRQHLIFLASIVLLGVVRTQGAKGHNWAVLVVCMVVLAVILFIIYILSSKTSVKRMAFTFSFVSVFLILVSLAFAFHKYNLDKLDNPAIVFAQETKVKNEPNLRSEEAFRLHEGTKVQVLDTIENWKKIKLSDGKMGWISSEDIKLLKTF